MHESSANQESIIIIDTEKEAETIMWANGMACIAPLDSDQEKVDALMRLEKDKPDVWRLQSKIVTALGSRHFLINDNQIVYSKEPQPLDLSLTIDEAIFCLQSLYSLLTRYRSKINDKELEIKLQEVAENLDEVLTK